MQTLSFLSQLNHWQIDLATFGILLASAVLTVVPEELIFVTLGFLARYGHVHPVEALVAAKLGLVSADLLTVWFGRKLGHSVIYRKPFCFFFEKEAVFKSLEKLKTSGNLVLFFARFLPFLRAPVYLAAGISGFSLKRSLIIDTFAAIIQVSAFFLLGYVFGDGVSQFVTAFSFIIPGALLLFALVSLVKKLAYST